MDDMVKRPLADFWPASLCYALWAVVSVNVRNRPDFVTRVALGWWTQPFFGLN